MALLKCLWQALYATELALSLKDLAVCSTLAQATRATCYSMNSSASGAVARQTGSFYVH